MKIIHLTTVDMSLRFLLLAQLEAAVAQGHDVIGVSAPGPHIPFLEARGVRHIALESSTRAMSPAADIRAARHLWRILKDEHPDVLHTHNPKPGLYGRAVGRLAGVPRVVNTVHGLYATSEDPIPRRMVVYVLETIAARFSHVELVQNPEDLHLLARLHMTPQRKLKLLGNGVDLGRFRPTTVTEGERSAARRALGLNAQDVVVGTVGRLVAEKGYLELFDAARLLPHSARLVVVGPRDADKADALPPAAIDAAERAGVMFLGQRDDVERLYPLFDVFVLASHREGFPRAAMEAAASGLPVIATNIRGCRQVVADGENGFLVPPRSPGDLLQGISALVDDPDLRSRMGQRSRAKAEAEFNEGSVVDIVMASYQTPRSGRRTSLVTKRCLDILVAVSALAFLSPVMATVALLVRLRLGRPILFRQERPGLNAQPFTILKFRTMRNDRDENGELLDDAERLTGLGKMLRASSLDELPELVNVLRGEMSLVGPRPLLPHYVQEYSPQQGRRHDVRPGISGWAQVNGRNRTSWRDRLEMDVWYVENWSLRLDFEILARTLRTVVRRTGIAHEGHQTMPLFAKDLPASARHSEPNRVPQQ